MLINPQFWQAAAAVIAALAALTGALYAVITRPLLSHIATMQTGIQGQYTGLQAQLTDIQNRLTRIESKLDDHANRIAHLEVRR